MEVVDQVLKTSNTNLKWPLKETSGQHKDAKTDEFSLLLAFLVKTVAAAFCNSIDDPV